MEISLENLYVDIWSLKGQKEKGNWFGLTFTKRLLGSLLGACQSAVNQFVFHVPSNGPES